MKWPVVKVLIHPVFYSTDRSKVVVPMLFLLFAALCSFVVPALLFAYIVMLALWSLSTAAKFAFCFTSCD